MKGFTVLVLLLVSTITVVCQSSVPDREPGQLLIQLKSSGSDHQIPGLTAGFSNAGLKAVKQLSKRMNIWLFTFDPSFPEQEALLAKIRLHPSVSLAQFNHKVQEREIIPDDPSFVNEWALKNTGQMNGTPGADIRATYAWDITTSGITANGDTIVVAMVDGGVDLGHSDLKLWKNRLETPFNGVDDDENGYIDDYNGWNAYMNSGNMQQSDHGTHVAGIATAKGNNNTGVAGVAYNTYLMPVAGSSTDEAVVVIAYDYVFEMRKRYNETNGAAGAFIVVSNSSFGVDAGNPANYPLWGAMYDSLGSAGILNVASTANRGWDVDVNGDIPTAMTNESIVAVTNTTNTDILNTQAGWGLNSIDLGAPGTSIYSTRQGDTYGYKSGTSMSSPFVSGSIALMYAAANQATLQLYDENPPLVASRFKRYLIASVDSLDALEGKSVSGGRLNLFNALQMVQNPPFITSDPPEVTVVMEQNTADTVTVLLTSHNSEINPYTVEIADTIHWVFAEVPGGLLVGSNPGTLKIIFNTTGLNLGIYRTTMTIKDYFLNDLVVNLEVKVEEDVHTRLITSSKATLTARPNPFITGTSISVILKQASDISLTAYDMNGRQVSGIFDGFLSAGAHEVKWNSMIKPGIYLIKLVCNEDVQVMKVVKK
ncbi:MAG: peptidase S8 and S53 subtilisin kexin sedolisin [Bacteroidetes bacterium]|nr:MAG: peptidase S8 and S53 subtilisin kexin sedolisin [Bacteroidota bacterium]